MEVGEPQGARLGGQGVNVRSLDLGPKAPAVAEPKVIGYDDQKVRATSILSNGTHFRFFDNSQIGR
jgi:hypothetical protein